MTRPPRLLKGKRIGRYSADRFAKRVLQSIRRQPESTIDPHYAAAAATCAAAKEAMEEHEQRTQRCKHTDLDTM